MLAVVLGLLSGLSWGVADFFGGVASRRAAALAVVVLSQAMGLVLILAIVGVLRPDVPPARDLAFASAAGAVGLIGLAAFYRAMSVGTISLIAPISALGAAVPIVVDLLAGAIPGALALVGMLVALGGAALAARAPGPASRRGVGLALVAAVGFGGFFSLLAEGAETSPAWAILTARGTSVPIGLIALVATGTGIAMARRTAAFVVASGCLDVTANLLFAAGSRHGAVSVVAVLGSLYPVTTVMLAATLLHERLGRLQALGAGIALAGVVLIAAG